MTILVTSQTIVEVPKKHEEIIKRLIQDKAWDEVGAVIDNYGKELRGKRAFETVKKGYPVEP